MNKRKRITSFISAIMAIFIVFNIFVFNVHADESEYITYNVDAGISINLPDKYEYYAIWNQAQPDSPGWKNNNFPSFETMTEQIGKDGIEFLSRREDGTPDSNYSIFIQRYDAPDEVSNQKLFEDFCVFNSRNNIDISNNSTLGYGVVNISDLTFFKLYFEKEDDFEKGYAYVLITDDGYSTEIVFINHGDKVEENYIDTLAYDAMSTIGLSDELRSHAVKIDDHGFVIENGYHLSVFDFEGGTANYSSSKISNTSSSNTTTIDSNIKKSLYSKITSFEFPTWIILVAFIAITVFRLKISRKGEWQEKPLSVKNTLPIKGFCAIAIIIHHLSQELMDKAGVLKVFSEYGVLFVGVFFFFSGYGLYTSLKTKDNYLKGFLSKRLTTVLIPLYVCILIFFIFACINGQSFSIPHLISTLTGWILINSHMWYIVEIAILYLAFYIIYSLVKNRKTATIIMSIFVVVMIIGSLLLGHGKDLSSKYWFMGEWWYNTTICFVLGIVLSQNEEKIGEFARKFYVILLPLFAALTIAFSYLTSYALNTWSYWNEYPGHPGYKEKFLCLLTQSSWVIFFVITVLLIMMKVRFGNRIINYVGKISLELYLIHNLFLSGIHTGPIMNIKSNSLYILLTILLSIGFASIINGLDKYIINTIRNNNLSKEKNNKRIHSIDTLRIVMAFLVVTIHIPFNGTTGNVFITYGKIAVPFFLTVCGYFLYRNNSEEMMPRLKKQALRIFILYIVSNILYGIVYAITLYIDGFSFQLTTKQILDFILYNMSPFSEHLWFLGSLLYALLILMLLNKLKAIDYAMFISPLLIIAYVVLSHLNVAQAYVLRNVILVGLPYTMMGMMIRRYEDKLLKINTPILWIVAIALCITAILELNFYPQGVGVPFISTEILVYVVVLLCLKYPDFGANTLAEKMGANLSLPIYIWHILTIIVLQRVLPANEGLISKYGAITVFVVTALITYLFKINKMKK